MNVFFVWLFVPLPAPTTACFMALFEAKLMPPTVPPEANLAWEEDWELIRERAPDDFNEGLDSSRPNNKKTCTGCCTGLTLLTMKSFNTNYQLHR
jgi:hypothetical protein